MAELINRQAVLNYIDRLQNSGTGKKKSLDFLRKYVEKLEEVEGQEWCTGEPPKYGDYIVTIHDLYEHRTYVDIGEYDEDGWNYKGFIEVKAWMPLPAPYKQEGQECKTMQVVIDIDEEDFKALQRKDKFDDMFLNYYEKLIVHGTPLPECHGDLIDRSKLDVTPIDITDLPTDRCLLVYMAEDVDNAPALVCADKESEGKE